MKRFLMVLMMGTVINSAPVSAGVKDNSLTVAFKRELETLDVYQNSSREGVILAMHVWDSLLYKHSSSNTYFGNLATEWQWIDDLTIEFKLRKGVKFHNGEKFDADDVVFTMNYIADPKNGVKPQRNVAWLKRAHKIDDYTVRIELDVPFPAALDYFAGPLVIYPNEYFEKVGSKGMGTKPIGTGPYEVTSSKQGEEIVLKSYSNYHKDGPKNTPVIDKIIWRTISENNTQFAELLSGGLDWIWQVPSDQASRFKKQDKFTVSNESTMRIGYLGFDAIGRSGENPFNDIRVRRAVSYAIDRQGIVDSLLGGGSFVVDSACFPTQLGCDTEVKKYSYDPDKAKQLLEEAGYKNGFDISFSAYRNRDYAEAMMANLADVGITTSLDYTKYAALRDKVQKGKIPLMFMTWGSYSINDVSAITSNFFRGGKDDYARDPEIIEWLTKADTTTDYLAREKNYSLALNKIADQAYWLPLFSYNSNYVYSKDLKFTPTIDEIPRFFSSKFK
ncbi:MAG: ABC transporter substrate-binding protein [Rhizobiales bacterium]|nr:ABC transporter substrate-binding protein [Hyphomicrobiales bacterium]